MYLNGNPRIAVDFGVNVSIFVQKLAEWTFINLANKKNIHDGHCWSFNTLEAYEEIFPWWSKRQLETLINNAVKDGLVLKGNYNQHKYDRTCWYALTTKALIYYPELTSELHLQRLAESISPNCEMYDFNLSQDDNVKNHFTKLCQAFHENVTTIPTTNPTKDISKDISGNSLDSVNGKKPKTKKTDFGIEDMLADNPHNIDEEVLSDWIDVRKTKKNKVTATAWNSVNKTLVIIQKKIGIKPHDAFETMVASGWQSLKLEYFLNSNGTAATTKSSGIRDSAGNEITWE